MRTGSIRLLCCALLSSMLLSPLVALAALPEKFPADTLLYVAWPGRDALAETFRDSAMAKILAEPEMAAMQKNLLPAIDKLIKAQGDEDMIEPYELCKTLLGLVYRYPTAFALVGVDARSVIPKVDAGMVVEAGEDSAKLAEALSKILENEELNLAPRIRDVEVGPWAMKEIQIMGPAMAIRWGTIDKCFVVAFGNRVLKQLVPGYLANVPGSEPAASDDAGAASQPTAAAKVTTLAENESFVKAMSVTGGSTKTPIVFVNLKSILDTLDAFQPMLAGFQIPVLGQEGGVKRILAKVGAENAQSLTIACTADGVGLKTTCFLHCPGLKSFGEPLTDAELAVIPKNASWASAGNTNLVALYHGILELVQMIAPDIHNQVMSFIAEGEKRLGMSIETDILGAFGDTWVIYDQPDNGSLLITGITVIAEVKPDNKIDAAMRAVVGMIAEQADANDKVSVRDETYRDIKIAYMNFKGWPIPVAPAWAEYQGHLIVALYPQMVRAALDRLMDKGPSLLENPDFVSGRKFLPADANSLSYIDTRRSVRHLYSLALPIAQALAGMGQEEGLELDVSMLPSLPTIDKHLFDNVSGSGNTPDGYVSVSYGAIPSVLPAIGQGLALAPIAASTAVLLPSLARARELSKRTVGAANLKQIGVALHTYAQDHDGALPPDLNTLIENHSITDKSLTAPGDPNAGEDRSYIYIGAGVKADMDAGIIVAYEKPELHGGEGANVLYLDAHVEFLMTDALDEALEKTKELLKQAGVENEMQEEQDEKQDGDTDEVKEQMESSEEKADEPADKDNATEKDADDDKETIELVRSQVAKGGPVATALEAYKLDEGAYPSRLQDLVTAPEQEELAEKWHGPYLKDADLLEDLWQRPLKYLCPGEINTGGYDLWSVGPDGKSGTADDVANFKK